MLKLNISNRVKPNTYQPQQWKPPTPTQYSQPGGVLLFSEATKRDGIIKKLLAECPYKVGDKVRPVSPIDFQKYGECVVHHICKKYTDLGKDHVWPQNNNPMIVTAYQSDGTPVFCTTNFMVKV